MKHLQPSYSCYMYMDDINEKPLTKFVFRSFLYAIKAKFNELVKCPRDSVAKYRQSIGLEISREWASIGYDTSFDIYLVSGLYFQVHQWVFTPAIMSENSITEITKKWHDVYLYGFVHVLCWTSQDNLGFEHLSRHGHNHERWNQLLRQHLNHPPTNTQADLMVSLTPQRYHNEGDKNASVHACMKVKGR